MPGYFALTGNPFIDAGVFVLSELLDKEIEEITPEDLKKPHRYHSLPLSERCLAKEFIFYLSEPAHPRYKTSML